MTLFMCQTGAGADRLAFTLGEKVQVFSNFREVRKILDEDTSELLVVIGPDMPMTQVRELMDTYRTSRPAMGVVLVRRRLDVVIMNEALQSGVREVVAFDDGEGIINACRRSLAISRKMLETVQVGSYVETHQGKVVIIFSAKGGCGKTTLSVNLAQSLAKDPETKVCIVDFDLQFGDIAVALQVEPTKNISNILGLGANVDSLALRSVVVNREKNLDLLLAPNNPADVELIDSTLANAILVNLKNMYDYVIVDSPPAFTEVILKAFDLADTCFLLTTLDMPAIKNLRVAMQTLGVLGLQPEMCNVVVNRSDSKAGLTVEDVEEAVGKKVVARIPTSRDVPRTTNRGETIVKAEPKHKVSKEIFAIADLVREKTSGKKIAPRRRLFSMKRSK